MNSIVLVVAAVCVLLIGYRFYGLWIARKVLVLDPNRVTPSVVVHDGRDFVKTGRYLLFGHHFAAIAAAGPLMGPILAAQYGYLPGTLWILIGSVLGGAVHDMMILFVSVRHKGRSLGGIAQFYLGPAGGWLASLGVLAILVMTMAGLSLVVVNAMAQSAWGTFTVFSSIPIALLMGFHMQYFRPGDVKGASIIGVTLLLLSVAAGHWVAQTPSVAHYFLLSKKQLAIAIPIYGFLASVLPVWMMLCPRDYLSSYLKIGTILLLALGIMVVMPKLQMPALTEFIHGNGPVIPGSMFPFLFITIACGAISGFHSLVSSGTTPKMIATEGDIPFIGYGAMVMEAFVAIMALISACVLMPADYFAINASPEVFAKMGLHTVDLDYLASEVQEQLHGRTGGGVSLAVGMAHIFSSLPGMESMMSYWYHYAIMFEALFILTAIDAGTRIGRFILQEIFGLVYRPFLNPKWTPGIILTGALFTLSWGYLVYTGDISNIWPVFGMSNQLLASCTLLIVSVMLLASGRGRYVWVSAVPGILMAVVTFDAGYLNILQNYWPHQRYMLSAISLGIMALMVLLFVVVIQKSIHYLRHPDDQRLAPVNQPQ